MAPWRASFYNRPMSDERRAVSLRGARRARGLRARGVILVFIALTAVVPFACGVDRDRGPPPPVAATTGSSMGGDVDAAAADDASVTEVDASAGNLCACAAGLFAGGDARCAVCIKSVSASGQPCEAARVACGADLACEAIIACIARCTRDGGAPEGCVSGCALPLDGDAAHRAYAALLGCACPRCPVCAASSPVACAFEPSDAGAGADGDANAGYDSAVMDASDAGEGDASAMDASSPGDGGEGDGDAGG